MKFRYRSVVFALALVTAIACSATATAQDDASPTATTSLQAGSHSLSFVFPTGDAGWGAPGPGGDIDEFYQVIGHSSIAYFYGLSDNIQLGPVGGVAFDGDNMWLSISPSLKYFLSTDRPVNPYLFGSIPFLFGPDTVVPGIGAGLGVEYFPAEHVSIGGRIGLTLGFESGADDRFAFWTGTSGLDVNFYF